MHTQLIEAAVYIHSICEAGVQQQIESYLVSAPKEGGV